MAQKEFSVRLLQSCQVKCEVGVQGWPFPRRRPASARVSVSLLDPLWLGVARMEDLKKEEELSSVVVWICIDGLIGRSEKFRYLWRKSVMRSPCEVVGGRGRQRRKCFWKENGLYFSDELFYKFLGGTVVRRSKPKSGRFLLT